MMVEEFDNKKTIKIFDYAYETNETNNLISFMRILRTLSIQSI